MSKVTKIKAIPVRELLKFNPLHILDTMSGIHYIMFDDKTVSPINTSEIVVSRYFWELFKQYNIPITSKYKISEYYTNGMFTGKTHVKFLSTLWKELIEAYTVNGNYSEEVINKIQYEMFRLSFMFLEYIYSELSYRLYDNSSSINIVDLLEIQLVKELMDSMDEVTKTMSMASVEKSYDVLDKVVREERFRNNQVAKAYISGMVNNNQMKQVLGPRGFVTELDSSIFKYPIASSFTLGLRNLYEMGADSRSGAKALYLSNKAIQDSEYFGRELQLATMTVEQLVMGDCGSTDYLNWYVKPKEEYAGVTVYKGDLMNLEGKWYLNEETNQLEKIDKKMTHLSGKTIKIRSAIKCKLSDKRHICSKCFGELSYAIPKHFNLGHTCSTEINSKISQSILSTKHLATSATSGSIQLDDVAKKFFSVKDKNGYVFKTGILTGKNKISLVITQDECFGLKDIMLNKDIHAIDPGSVSVINNITMKVENTRGTEYTLIPVRLGNRYGVLEPKFLKYIIDNGFETDDYGNFIISLNKWTSVSPILRLPEVEFSFLALSKDTKDMFKSMTVNKDGFSNESPDTLLSKVFRLVNSKLDINIALFEVVVYAFTVYDIKNGNYDLGRNSPDVQLANLLTIIDRRSAGASYGYDNLSGKILTPALFSSVNKCDHRLDVLFAPNEILKHRRV